jgi:hypothetical protein
LAGYREPVGVFWIADVSLMQAMGLHVEGAEGGGAEGGEPTEGGLRPTDVAAAGRDEVAAFARRSFEMTMKERAPEVVKGWAEEMKQRVIFGMASLREKLVLFEAGLDDRVIELLKLQLCQEGVQAMHADAYFHVTAVDSDEILFEVAAPPPGAAPRMLSILRQRYVMLELQRDVLRDHVPWLRDELVVDYRILMAPSIALAPAQGALS